MEEFYSIPEEPRYSEDIRKIQDSDPVSASAVVNPLIARLIENTAAVRRQAEENTKKIAQLLHKCPVAVTQAEYDALLASGGIDDATVYLIYRPEEGGDSG